MEKEDSRNRRTWPREERRKRDSRAAVRAGVAAGTVTYYVNITHLLRYIALYATVHKFPDTPENEIKHFGNITTIIWSSSS